MSRSGIIRLAAAAALLGVWRSPVGAENYAMSGKRAGEERTDNGLRLKVVWIPSGSFTMGSPESEKDRDDDENQVRVTLTKGFWLGKYEVTQSEWTRLMGTQPWSGETNVKEGATYPAQYVSWDDAVEFCLKLTEQERRAGRLPQGWEYTLPTEAQWEYACRAGTSTAYSFGASDASYSTISDYAWWGYEKFAHQVGQKRANPWKLHDMHGNVVEWCCDWYVDKLPGGTDPRGPSSGSERAGRGGGWGSAPQFVRVANRSKVTPDYRSDRVGFRVLCSSIE